MLITRKLSSIIRKTKKNGDFACNIALKLCKVVKNSPQETAEKILNEIILPTEIQKSEFAHPGFINFYLGIDYLTSRIQALINQQNIDLSSEANKTQKIIVEYSQPNIAKPLGVHHLLSTIIGQSLYNIHKSLGYDTISINHIGDWGTQFGKLIYAYRTWGDKDEIEKDPINELLKLYIKFHSESDKDPDLDDKGREEFKKLEDGDQENLKLLKWITEVSLKDVQKTYDLLGGIHFDHVQGESFYEKLMQPIIDNGIKKKIFTEGEKGALVVNYPDEKLPTCLVRKSDGATLYFTRDLATIRYRTDEWNPKKILYVIDTAQSLYMRQVFKAADMLWGKDNLPERTHVEFGRMSFPEGKMSTRKGTVILLFDFLKEAIEKAKDIVKEKNPEITNAEIEKIAKVIGVGSVKYAILSQNRNTNVVFTWQKMLSLEGNSAPYLQYAYARAAGILRKASDLQKDTNPTDNTPEDASNNASVSKDTHSSTQKTITLTQPEEIDLAKQILQFQAAVERAAEEYKPNLITNYLYKLTQTFHNFYSKLPVLKSSDQERATRLALVEVTGKTLKSGLNLLGIDVLDRM